MLIRNNSRVEKKNFKKGYIYECDKCGAEKWYRCDTKALTKPCECENTNKRVVHIFYKIYDRCNNPNNPRYKDYGGKGIKCEWDNARSFHDDMIMQYKAHAYDHGENNTTIDRIDNDGNYCKSNCRWATYETQNNNKTNNRFITIGNKTKSMTEWACELGISPMVVSQRINKLGWTEREALEIDYREKGGCSPLVEFNGETKTAIEWCKETGIPKATYHSRMKRGHDILSAVGLIKFERHNKAAPKVVKPRGKKILQLDLDFNVINTFESMKECSKKTGIKQPLISKVCNGERKKTGGFIFRFL